MPYLEIGIIVFELVYVIAVGYYYLAVTSFALLIIILIFSFLSMIANMLIGGIGVFVILILVIYLYREVIEKIMTFPKELLSCCFKHFLKS